MVTFPHVTGSFKQKQATYFAHKYSAGGQGHQQWHMSAPQEVLKGPYLRWLTHS